MRFFLDNCMSPYHAKGLRGFAELQKHEIVHLRERFDGNGFLIPKSGKEFKQIYPL